VIEPVFSLSRDIEMAEATRIRAVSVVDDAEGRRLAPQVTFVTLPIVSLITFSEA
jgi:hypothetical protein